MNTEVITNKLIDVFNKCDYAWIGKQGSEAKEIKSILDEALNMHVVGVPKGEQLKCECKHPTFTRMTDMDYNALCGGCGRVV